MDKENCKGENGDTVEPVSVFDRFYSIVKRLRRDCPWDREQTLMSLSEYLIEEGYEVIHEIREDNIDGVKEELGDVLLVTLMLLAILEEKGFDHERIVEGAINKIIARHPHVFGKDRAKSAEEVLERWERRKGKGWKEIGVGLPALIRSYRLQERASRKGFDWDDVSGVYEKIHEEIEEIKRAESENEKREELGDLLFVVSHLGNFLGINPEIALQEACDKFARRFDKLEKILEDKNIKERDLETLDKIWNQVKNEE